jgi:error-prone DNA polymerase
LDRVEHRRDALWQVEEAGRPVGPLLRDTGHLIDEPHPPMPVHSMTTDERLYADYSGTGLTTGPHPMAYRRALLRSEGILSARHHERCYVSS